MNQTETLAILSILRAAYPNFYRGMTPADAKGVAALWQEMFSAEPYELVAAAVKALLACDDKGYPPHIGAVKESIRKLSAPETMTEAEAWAMVYEALKRSAYNAAQEFDKLPPELQALVGSPSQLKDWAIMDADTVQSVVASNFQRSYKVRSQSARELSKLPPEVRAALPTFGSLPSLAARDDSAREPRPLWGPPPRAVHSTVGADTIRPPSHGKEAAP